MSSSSLDEVDSQIREIRSNSESICNSISSFNVEQLQKVIRFIKGPNVGLRISGRKAVLSWRLEKWLINDILIKWLLDDKMKGGDMEGRGYKYAYLEAISNQPVDAPRLSNTNSFIDLKTLAPFGITSALFLSPNKEIISLSFGAMNGPDCKTDNPLNYPRLSVTKYNAERVKMLIRATSSDKPISITIENLLIALIAWWIFGKSLISTSVLIEIVLKFTSELKDFIQKMMEQSGSNWSLSSRKLKNEFDSSSSLNSPSSDQSVIFPHSSPKIVLKIPQQVRKNIPAINPHFPFLAYSLAVNSSIESAHDQNFKPKNSKPCSIVAPISAKFSAFNPSPAKIYFYQTKLSGYLPGSLSERVNDESNRRFKPSHALYHKLKLIDVEWMMNGNEALLDAFINSGKLDTGLQSDLSNGSKDKILLPGTQTLHSAIIKSKTLVEFAKNTLGEPDFVGLTRRQIGISEPSAERSSCLNNQSNLKHKFLNFWKILLKHVNLTIYMFCHDDSRGMPSGWWSEDNTYRAFEDGFENYPVKVPISFNPGRQVKFSKPANSKKSQILFPLRPLLYVNNYLIMNTLQMGVPSSGYYGGMDNIFGSNEGNEPKFRLNPIDIGPHLLKVVDVDKLKNWIQNSVSGLTPYPKNKIYHPFNSAGNAIGIDFPDYIQIQMMYEFAPKNFNVSLWPSWRLTPEFWVDLMMEATVLNSRSKEYCKRFWKSRGEMFPNNSKTPQKSGEKRKQPSDETSLEKSVPDQLLSEDFSSFSKLSLRDPLTYLPLTFPARGRHCDHLGCFDLLSFLRGNFEVRAEWKCPICFKRLTLSRWLVWICEVLVEILDKNVYGNPFDKIDKSNPLYMKMPKELKEYGMAFVDEVFKDTPNLETLLETAYIFQDAHGKQENELIMCEYTWSILKEAKLWGKEHVYVMENGEWSFEEPGLLSSDISKLPKKKSKVTQKNDSVIVIIDENENNCLRKKTDADEDSDSGSDGDSMYRSFQVPDVIDLTGD